MTSVEEAGEQPSPQPSWARRHPWLTTVFLVTALGIPAFFGIVGFFWMSGGFPFGGEARRPLKFPRDTATAERIVTWVHENGDCRDMYVELPRDLAAFTAGGLASCRDATVFLPQWSGTPDDAGGYWYSPNESPEGFDMWGMVCRGPEDLGDGWWKCGMGD